MQCVVFTGLQLAYWDGGSKDAILFLVFFSWVRTRGNPILPFAA